MLPLIISLEKLKERHGEESCTAFLFLYVTNSESITFILPNSKWSIYELLCNKNTGHVDILLKRHNQKKAVSINNQKHHWQQNKWIKMTFLWNVAIWLILQVGEIKCKSNSAWHQREDKQPLHMKLIKRLHNDPYTAGAGTLHTGKKKVEVVCN